YDLVFIFKNEVEVFIFLSLKILIKIILSTEKRINLPI
ncbi:unnamed protein product, partial [marine sediment metagenome]